MEKPIKKKESLTREEREEMLKEFGIEMAAPDDPIYKQGITIRFLKRDRISNKKTKE